jgi:hypothetical protein
VETDERVSEMRCNELMTTHRFLKQMPRAKLQRNEKSPHKIALKPEKFVSTEYGRSQSPNAFVEVIQPSVELVFISSRYIALGYGLDNRGSRVRFPAWAGNFSLHHRVQNGSGAHPATYPMGINGSFPGGKTAGA